MHLEAQNLAGLQPGVGHVVAVANPCNGFALDAAAVFDVGKDVGQNLAGVKLVGQAVDDRHTRMLGKAVDFVLLVGTNHHQVYHAADDLGAVFNRLGAAQLTAFSRQVHHRAAELVHASFKAHAGAGGGLFKNHHQRAVYQRLVFFVGLELLFDQRCTLKQVRIVGCIQIAELQVMLDRFIH